MGQLMRKTHSPEQEGNVGQLTWKTCSTRVGRKHGATHAENPFTEIEKEVRVKLHGKLGFTSRWSGIVYGIASNSIAFKWWDGSTMQIGKSI